MFDAFETLAHRETSDSYQRVITLFGRHRVVVGSCNHQWIIQRAVGKGAGRRWVAIDYCRTRSRLIGLWHCLHRADNCESWPELERLPEHFQAGGEFGAKF